MVSPSPNIETAPTVNSISIDSGKISIFDPHKPVLYINGVMLAFFGITALINGFYFSESNKIYNMILLVFSVIFLSVILVRELIFRTYEDEIKLFKVTNISIRRIPAAKGKVNLVIHLRRKKRLVCISETKALEIKSIFRELHY